jgi:ribosomal protein S18 acetylase RimI-like enzyme
MLSYGRIVLDAARPARELLAVLDATPGHSPESGREATVAAPWVRKATKADAQALAKLDERLATHIGAAPVLMPGAHGSTIEEWEDWLEEPDTVTFVAESANGGQKKLFGFIKADPPHFDVSWFVHDRETLAICGLYVDPAHRGMNVGATLLRELAAHAVDRGYGLVSVDCETHNPEARAFWLSRFEPVSWSFERRF